MEVDTTGPSDRVGRIFALLMQLRVLLAAVSILLAPPGRSVTSTLMIVGAVALLSWLCARFWPILLPKVLEHPLLAAADVLLSFAILGLGYAEGPVFFFTLVTACLAGLLFNVRGAVAVCLLQIGCYYLVLSTRSAELDSDVMMKLALGQPLYYPVTGFFGVTLRKLLEEQTRQDEARARAEAAAAGSEERARLAREMHDSLAKTLRGIALNAESLALWVVRDRDRAVVEAERIASATEIASREARDLLTDLRTDTLDLPLSDVVRSVCEDWGAQQSVKITFAPGERAELSSFGRHELLSILREALENVARHARASAVLVELRVVQGELVLTVQDDGAGFLDDDRRLLAKAGHYGLIGMGERAARVGGTVTIDSGRGRGTAVTARFPLSESPFGGDAHAGATGHGR